MQIGSRVGLWHFGQGLFRPNLLSSAAETCAFCSSLGVFQMIKSVPPAI